MRAHLRYGKVRDLDSDWSRSPAAIVSDVLGQRADLEYATYLAFKYGPRFGLFSELDTAASELDTGSDKSQVARSVLQALLRPTVDAQVIADAATAAAKGRIEPELGEHLARITRLPGGAFEVGDLAALAAWALDELLRRGPLDLAECPSCGRPFVPERGELRCNRPAPGTMVRCRQLAAEQRYKSAHSDFHRQRRRLYDRMKRGTLDPNDYEQWLRANRPGPLGKTWVTFEDWTAGKRPKGGKTHGKR